MREDEFRDRLRAALGEPPRLADPVLRRPAGAAARLHPRGMALIAVALAILLVVVLIGSRLTLQPRANVVPAATPSSQTQPALDSLPCHLAVNFIQEADNPGGQSSISSSVGFVNVPSGTFQVDPQARVSDLPAASGTVPSIYSGALGRWLPASTRTLSPDATSYAYVKLLPAGAAYNNATGGELHVVNAATRTDTALWSQPADVELIEWTSAGILASTVPLRGGVGLLWRINPATGAASRASDSDDPRFFQLSGYAGMHNFSYLGTDSSGRSIFYLGSRDAGTKYYVVLVDGGSATTIYSGTVGDSTHFDPSGFFDDAHGIWFGNINGDRVWLWTRAAGLKWFAVSGAPAAPAGYQFTSRTFMPAGPCIPGEFQGVAAVGQPPATAPTPSPTPPPVDWAPFLAKPMLLGDLSPGAACPISAQVTLQTKMPPGAKGGPDYGYGQGPAYLSGQVNWYSGQQGMLVLVDPRYSGPVLIRSKRLDGSGSIAFTGDGDSLAGGALGVRQTSSPPYWGQWFGSIDPSSPGCYEIQFDGTTFSDYAVIEVKQGPPPPG